MLRLVESGVLGVYVRSRNLPSFMKMSSTSTEDISYDEMRREARTFSSSDESPAIALSIALRCFETKSGGRFFINASASADALASDSGRDFAGSV